MYLQFKHGFISAVRHANRPGLPATFAEEIRHAQRRSVLSNDLWGTAAVVVVRSREERTLKWCVARLAKDGRPGVLRSPANWDYEWRCYMSLAEWGSVLVAITQDLDYSNFKNWCHDEGTPGQLGLAYDTWHSVQRHKSTSVPRAQSRTSVRKSARVVDERAMVAELDAAANVVADKVVAKRRARKRS